MACKRKAASQEADTQFLSFENVEAGFPHALKHRATHCALTQVRFSEDITLSNNSPCWCDKFCKVEHDDS